MSRRSDRWEDLSERQRWRASDALEAGRPLDEDVAPAMLEMQRSSKRRALHLAWLGPVSLAPIAALGVALATGDGAQGLLSSAARALWFTLPLTAVYCAALAYWLYSLADQHERRLLQQLGEPVAARSRRARAARTVARAAIALLMGLILTPLLTIPVWIPVFLVILLVSPTGELPTEIGTVLGLVAYVAVAAGSYRWLRTSPSSAVRLDGDEGT